MVLTTIKVLYAKALLAIVDPGEKRPHLRGVWFDSRGYAMATNGSLLLAISGLQPVAGPEVFVGCAELKEALKGAKARATVGVCDDGLYVESKRVLTPPTRSGGELKAIDWVRIVPTQFNGERADFDSALVEQMRHALEVCEALEPEKIPTLYTNGYGRVAMVHTPDNVLALVMPLTRPGKSPDLDEAASKVLRFLAGG